MNPAPLNRKKRVNKRSITMEKNVNDNVIETKSLNFAVRIVKLYRYLNGRGCERDLSRQLLRCGTSIGANVAEGVKGQTRADFNSKFNIALKEANEALYWLKLLEATEYITEKEFVSIYGDLREIISILIAIVKKTN